MRGYLPARMISTNSEPEPEVVLVLFSATFAALLSELSGQKLFLLEQQNESHRVTLMALHPSTHKL